LVFPPLAIIAGALPILEVLLGIFTSEARTASYNAQQDLKNFQRTVETLPPSANRWFKFVLHVGAYKQEVSRPLCQAGTEACSNEHFIYASETKIMLECGTYSFNLVDEYLNEVNFKKFIDDYQLIKASILATIKGHGTGSGSGTIKTQSSGCLGTLAIIIFEISTLTYFISQLL